MSVRYRDPETGRFISEEDYMDKYGLPEGEETDYGEDYDWDYDFGEEEYGE